ncbi:hypothetical protein MQC88_02900 [Luteimonas sp. 50]|uniref:SMODS and SLOG-associating 2TM effector domain-containing protein n=1 Tax=Cognatiluteimonas sedimenti TaxID=2927791 RepID=A0ABT0A1S9_9GAMM|nr:hypothetical protein [Lysobacter sedimenti]MCJ0824916.1 hypothetical protein [Lysobacter sedimenti]
MQPGPHGGARTGHAAPATALVVGVTSHRDLAPAQLPALRRQLRDAFAGLRERFPELQPVVLSPLAEGGDRLVAEAGLEQGARLVVPLPLPARMYAQDFATAQSRAQFERLLEQAQVVALPLPEGAGGIEALHVPGALRDRQYLLAGLYVASHCHVLFALWDGSDEGGVGGTAQIVRYYLGGPLPGARRASDNLRQMLSGDDDSLVLHLPVQRASQHAPPGLDGQPRWLTSAGQRPLAAGMPPDYRRIFERMQVFERDRLNHAAAGGDAMPPGDPAQAQALLVDAMAVRYQRRTTAAMRAIHGLAVLMGLAFLLYSDLGAPDWMLWVFLAFFVVGLAIALLARHRDWHRKYIDYRALAEGLRVQAFWRRAGLSMTGDPEFAHDNFMQKQDVELGWIRNVMRQVGLLPLPRIDDPQRALDDVIEDWVGRPGQSGQLAYYERKAALRARHHLRTQALGAACLWAGIGISLFLALFHGGLEDAARNLLVTTMGALSLVAAVREAYAYRKADKELVKQYRFMHRIYRNARAALDAAPGMRERREILRALGEAALEEHAEWALMHRDRPIEHGRP